MKLLMKTLSFCVAVGLLSAPGFAGGDSGMFARPGERILQFERVVQSWSGASQRAAMEVARDYGLPDEVTPSRMIWFNNGPWKRTTVYRDEVLHNFPAPHTDVLEQTIDYKVAPHLYDELAVFDGSVLMDRTRGEMSARCDKEGANFLALNLAHKIIVGELKVQEARKAFGDNILLSLGGETPELMRQLTFVSSLGTGLAGDPDETIIDVDQPESFEGIESADRIEE